MKMKGPPRHGPHRNTVLDETARLTRPRLSPHALCHSTVRNNSHQKTFGEFIPRLEDRIQYSPKGSDRSSN